MQLKLQQGIRTHVQFTKHYKFGNANICICSYITNYVQFKTKKKACLAMIFKKEEKTKINEVCLFNKVHTLADKTSAEAGESLCLGHRHTYSVHQTTMFEIMSLAKFPRNWG